jgi:hypothetical protein
VQLVLGLRDREVLAVLWPRFAWGEVYPSSAVPMQLWLLFVLLFAEAGDPIAHDES